MLGSLARPCTATVNSEIVIGYNVVGTGNSTFVFGGGTLDTNSLFGSGLTVGLVITESKNLKENSNGY